MSRDLSCLAFIGRVSGKHSGVMREHQCDSAGKYREGRGLDSGPASEVHLK